MERAHRVGVPFAGLELHRGAPVAGGDEPAPIRINLPRVFKTFFKDTDFQGV